MDILIIADFCGDFLGQDNNRFVYLAELLAKDNNVEILTSDYNHGKKQHFESAPDNFNFKITMLHEEAYPRNICLQRFISHYSWGKKVGNYLKQRKCPEVIYCALPTLVAANKAAKFCKKNNIRFVIDIQDLWPEAFKMVFSIPVISNLIFLPFSIIANGAYKRADEICAVSETYVNRALEVNKNKKEGHTVYLGTNLYEFDHYSNKGSTLDKKDEEVWIGYCGSLSDSYDIKCVVDALSTIDNAPLFVVMGDGIRKDEFEKYAKEKKVKSIFTGMLPYSNMCAVLKQCDIVVNPIVGKSAASIINKHADYAASGLPVINTQESIEYRKLIDEYQMGFNCLNGSYENVAKKIIELVNNPELRSRLGKNARRCAEEKFDRKNSYEEIVRVIVK